MTFARLNGWRLSVDAKKTASKKVPRYGAVMDRWSGRPSPQRKSIERSWIVNTTKGDIACSDTLEGLTEGINHHFSFVHDAWSESGLGPELGSSWTLGNTTGPLATRGHSVIIGGGGLTYNPQFIDDPVAPLGGRWTVIYWYNNSGTWVRRALRSDGTKFENGASSTATFGEITVLIGAVAFASGEEIADLVLLSFYACDEFLSDEYDWVSGLNSVFHAPMDTGYVDIVGARIGAPTGIDIVKGQVGFAAEGDAAGDEIVYAMDADLAVFGHSGKTWAFWTRVDTFVSGTWFLGNRTGGAGVQISTVAGASQPIAILAELEQATTDASTTVDAFAAGGLNHVAVTWNDTDNRLLVYVNGSLVSATSQAAGSGAVVDDTSNDLYVLNSPASTDGLRGSIDDVRVFNRQLSAAQVLELYRCGRDGQRYPDPRFFSSLPRLELWGDIDGCRKPIEVMGEIASQAHISHGGTSGWVNNDVVSSVALNQVKHEPSCDRVPTPDLAWLMTTETLDDPSSAGATPVSIRGAFPLQNTGMDFTNRGFPGPFNKPDSSFNFSGDYLDLDDENIAQILYGAQGCTIAAWVYPTSVASGATIFNTYIDNVGSRRVNLQMAAGGDIDVGARSAVADALQIGNAPTVIVANEWQLVGCTIDLANDTIETFRNGQMTSSDTGLSFSLTRFSDEGPTIAPYGTIGNNQAASLPWPGRIASTCVWRRVITPGEIHSLYEIGKKGVFS